MQRSLGETRATSQTSRATNGINGDYDKNVDASSSQLTLELDALVVGAGFSGCYLLHLLRKEGFSVKVVEAGTGLGGIWHWNSYPGARVDSQYPIYQYSLPEVYTDWRWSEAYPGSAELRAYFRHVDKQLDLSKDVIFSSKVISAVFDETQDKWLITCDTGVRITARFFLPCTGFAAKRHFPDWPGLDSFRGTICHSSFWPESGLDVAGKRVAVIGTGATGIQIAQETARIASQLTVFQRTPNLCCPMRQSIITPEQAMADLKDMPATMAHRSTTFAGFLYQSQGDKKTFDHTPAERRAFFQSLWDMGGFRMLANNYGDMLSDRRANREAYDFWAEKTRERITDPVKKEILAPLEPPHYFGGKRLSLEQDFYEQMNKEFVEIVDIKRTPVTCVTESGIVTSDGKEREFDVIAVATGFDSFTGGLKDMNIVGMGGEELNEKWRLGTWTAFGITVSGFPNFFFLYGPQAPTAYANGPSITEPQARWVRDVVVRMRGNGVASGHETIANGVNGSGSAHFSTTKTIDTTITTNGNIENHTTNKPLNVPPPPHQANGIPPNPPPTTKTKFQYTLINASPSSEREWRDKVIELHKGTLRNEVESWYMGSNIPGKPREPLNYAGGIPEYLRELELAVEEVGNVESEEAGSGVENGNGSVNGHVNGEITEKVKKEGKGKRKITNEGNGVKEALSDKGGWTRNQKVRMRWRGFDLR